MNDHVTLTARHDDITETTTTLDTRDAGFSETSVSGTPRAIPDATTRLVADVLGMTADRTTEILRAFNGLEGLAHATEPELVAASIPRTRARLVRAAFELGRLGVGERPQLGKRLSCSTDVWLHMQARLSGIPVEEFWAIALDVRHRVVVDSMMARGSLSGVEVHPRDVFRALIQAGAEYGQIDPVPHNSPPLNLGRIIAVAVVISVGLLLLIFA